MEFHEKLQQLRKRKKLTQEELAQALFVSRTAVSKWESGRGYPNIDSLKTIAKYFGVSVDELLSGEELLTIAEADTRNRENHLRDIVFGLLDISAAMFLFLPFFGQKVDGNIREVSLLALTEISLYLKIVYFAVVASMVTTGILTLSMQNWEKTFWARCKAKLSCGINATGALLFIVSLQPYAAAFLFLFLVIKVLMVIKWR
jgi:transcriptional regulator with XRE-family HTH domain